MIGCGQSNTGKGSASCGDRVIGLVKVKESYWSWSVEGQIHYMCGNILSELFVEVKISSRSFKCNLKLLKMTNYVFVTVKVIYSSTI